MTNSVQAEVEAAIEAAAEAGDRRISVGVHTGPHVVSSERRHENVRNTIRRFLEELPEHLSVRDLLDVL